MHEMFVLVARALDSFFLLRLRIRRIKRRILRLSESMGNRE